VSPDEEQNLNRYVQVLENLLLSVPTRELEKKSKSPKHVYSAGVRSLLEEAASTPGEGLGKDALPSPSGEESTAHPAREPTRRPGRRKRPRTTTVFWTIKPNNVSVVLRADEPYIEKDDPEPEPVAKPKAPPKLPPAPKPEPQPEPEPEPAPRVSVTKAPRASTIVTHTWTTSHITTATKHSEMDSEDVPQLSGELATRFGEPLEPHSHTLSNDDILRKISEISAEVHHGPLGDSNNPEYREDIKASREQLQRSLALAAAAEHRLQKMHRSHVFFGGRSNHGVKDMETVINTLYNSRSKLSEYLNIRYVPPEMRGKVTTVLHTLRKILCSGQMETQNLIRKLLSNNIKILNLLDIPSQNRLNAKLHSRTRN
jgi:hypothetical protein